MESVLDIAGDVVDRDILFGMALGRTVVGMTVEDDIGAVNVYRIGEKGGAQFFPQI